jgi:hypothetical protein
VPEHLIVGTPEPLVGWDCADEQSPRFHDATDGPKRSPVILDVLQHIEEEDPIAGTGIQRELIRKGTRENRESVLAGDLQEVP